MNKKILYILSIAATLFFVSCDNYLDTTPDNRTVLDSDEKVKELLTSAYPEYSYGMFSYSMSDNVQDKGIGHNTDINNDQGYAWEEFTSTYQDSPSGFWDACYQSIAHANQALEFIEDQEVNGAIPSEYLPYYGEALVIRAYSHFMLVNFWGKHYDPATANTDLGIPYVTEVENVVFKDYKRETVAKVYELIEKDLLEGIQYIDDEAYDVAKYHFNLAAVNTFASRFYLYKGEWQKVVDYSTAALGANASTKLRDLSGKYAEMGLNEQVNEYSLATEPANFMLASNVTTWFNYFQATLRYSYTSDLKEKLYLNIFVMEDPNNNWAQSTANYGNDDIVVMKWGYFFKRSGINADLGYFYAMVPTIVAEEALFNRAEANIMLQKYTDAEQDLNLYFEKRILDYDDSNRVSEENIVSHYQNNSYADSPLNPWYELDEKTQTYLNCVIDIRRKEFIYNGLRWFDIRRFNIKVVHKIKDGAPIELKEKDARKVLQIPVAAQQFGLIPNNR
ncbi:RagB/SusD family nutrient uptake outer membrane protein [Ancylomarina salipaludis]|uniref:RagB/SusD family nutrient uptake outer membrane protein n=1 Tax=Ancylomarina salipaludis TaxID=2501299 RepID=A0A4Q1JPG7_9BACT|nr:RagB/SusD family nutrient uptake outer membrane protein [Ancylomarina salipaludis]RXQ96722.1 RagB/SusD family nutrient uptake outer membrane protein [Ancylomarina salipaludis]